MNSTKRDPARNPKAFVSYTWDDDAHQAWVRELATRLCSDGVEVTLDQWHLEPGDQVTMFIERAIRENDYVLIVCTPRYKERSQAREGGAGYEGNIITAEMLTTHNERKFIPVFRAGNTWSESAPSWLLGKYYVDLRGDPYKEDRYQDIITTIHGLRSSPPPIANPPQRASTKSTPMPAGAKATAKEAPVFEPIRIVGVLVDQVTQPRRDGTPGSALYSVPFQLSRQPSSDWETVFIEKWDHPRQFTSMHRPGIARVSGNVLYLNGTTMEEVERYHRETLKLTLADTNAIIEAYEKKKRIQAERTQADLEQHERDVREAAKRIKFD